MFEMQFGTNRRKNDRFVCKDWQSQDTSVREQYLELLNNPLITDRIHMLDICGVTISCRADERRFRIIMDT